MPFGQIYLSSQHPKWAGEYIDYGRLKKLIKPLLKAAYPEYYQRRLSVDDSSEDTTTVNSTLYATSTETFQCELNDEIQKAVLFLLTTLGELASEATSFSSQRRYLGTVVKSIVEGDENPGGDQSTQRPLIAQQKIAEMEDFRSNILTRVGCKLLLLLEFVELNIQAIDNIVKKHDKAVAAIEKSRRIEWEVKAQYKRLRREYLPRFASFSPNPNVRCLYHIAADAGDSREREFGVSEADPADGNFGGFDVIQSNLECALREIFNLESRLKDLGAPKKHTRHTTIAGGMTKSTSVDVEASLSGVAKSPLRRKRSLSNAGPIPHTGSLVNLLARSRSFLDTGSLTALNATSADMFFEPTLHRIQLVRRRMGQTNQRYLQMLYAHEMVHLVTDKKHMHEKDEKYIIKRRDEFASSDDIRALSDDVGQMVSEDSPTVSDLSKFLNLASAGLYMMNYNIVAPTSGLYADLLGFDPANAGIIIGMTPLAVTVSSILYSWGSSYSYKRALLFASCCCCAGNLVYALALPCRSLKMVLFGRLLTGFGSARVINRRYIADYYSLEDRTTGMSQFVSASALGMALGPAFAAALSIVAPSDVHPEDENWWTIETAPGYIMFALWGCYFLLNFFHFEEPDRQSAAYAATQPPKKREVMLTKQHSACENTPLITKEVTGSPENVQIADQLPSGNKTAHSIRGQMTSCFGHIPVMVSLLLLMLLKSVLEGISSSAPTLSRHYFHWGVDASGAYLAFLASMVLPTTVSVARFSRRYDDRELIVAMLTAMVLGITGFLVYGEHYSETRFILFGCVSFVASNALEGPTMGLLSKVIPKSLAAGVLNAGLLATEAGTFGRVFGDFWLSNAAFAGVGEMLNRTFKPMLLSVVVMLAAVLGTWEYLQPSYTLIDDDYDDDTASEEDEEEA
mmetsp:Transcript_16368/g.37871  ORF Transcript_16368/g.37871 Transcript_16368/m.37871 type:complete len:911 (-) Transcript_16368:60-2792(-)